MAFRRPGRDVDRVFLHCSASDKPAHDDIAVIRDWHVNGNGWDDVGYHYFIRKDGIVEAGRPLEMTPAAQAGHNTATIAICLHGLAKERFTKAQYRSLIALTGETHHAYGGMITFHGHTEVSAKSCPVFDYRSVLGLDDSGGFALQPTESPDLPAGPASPATVPAPKPVPPTLRLMSHDPAVVLLQHLLGEHGHELEEDGRNGQATLAAVKAFQAANGLRPDGIVGPRSWAVLSA